MRCRNCHTVMMDTDPECPTCHASVASATSAAPGVITKPSPWINLLPAFGGAAGGLLAGVLISATSSNGVPSSGRYPAARSSGSLRRVFGTLFAIVGGLFLAAAVVQFSNTWKIAHRQPKTTAAAELLQENSKSPTTAWLAYDFAESKPTTVTVKRQRLGHGGDVKAQCLLVRVADKWLLASVAPGFEGNRLVGRLVAFDSSSEPLLEQLRQAAPEASLMLPYEFNGVDGSASDQRDRYLGAAFVGVLGALGLLGGLRLLFGKRRPAQVSSAPETNWTLHPVPSR
jgi:hypothetical protein